MKHTVEINDTLQERVDDAIEMVRDALNDHLKENKPDRCPDLSDLDYSGTIHEIVDGSVPIYTKEIEDLWYLYKREFIEAYENAGVGTNPMENEGMSAIYFYIYDQVVDWYRTNSDEIFEEYENGRE